VAPWNIVARGFLDQIIDFAICDTAAEAAEADITPDRHRPRKPP
jgi:hypothetical protein